ncbi:tRNA synthetases class I (W and Y) [Globodera pallida]|nr:tRNA synthetases class I (W and Y) [Globodera pallida]
MLPYNLRKILPLSDSQPLASFIQDLIRRKLLINTHPEFPYRQQDISAYASTLPNVVYAGVDPTASSLHIGNLLVLNSLIRASFFGCSSIALIGEATAFVGDPSGHKTDRNQLSRELIHENAKAIRRQVERLWTNVSSLCGDRISLEIKNNADWYNEMRVLDFFNSAKRFRVSELLRGGPVKSRMDDGGTLSYSEFSYQTLQAIDWLKLSEENDCLCQIGGTDQFGNFKAGFEHVRENTGRLSIALCLPLLTDESGQKLGKSSEHQGLWLDPSKTSAFAFFQYFRQLHDDVAEYFFINFSLRKTAEVEEIIEEHRKQLGKWIAQMYLAEEITAIVHGKEGLEKAKKCSKILFGGSFIAEFESFRPDEITEMFGSASTFDIKRGSVKTMGELAVITKQDGLNLMRKGALKINGVKMTDPEEKVSLERILINGHFTIVCWARRKFYLIKWS